MPLYCYIPLCLIVCGAAVLAPAGVAFGQGDGDQGLYFGDPGQAIASVIIFGVLLLVLGRWAWKPLVNQLQAREQRVTDALEHADMQRRQAQSLLKQYESRLAAAEEEAQKLLADTRQEAAVARDGILSDARTESGRLAQQVRTELDHARSEAQRELYEHAAQLATELAGELLRKNLDPETQRRMLSDSLDEIRRQGPARESR